MWVAHIMNTGCATELEVFWEDQEAWVKKGGIQKQQSESGDGRTGSTGKPVREV